jgi:uncharacterized protein YraI
LTASLAVAVIAVGMSLTLAVPAFASVTGKVITPSGVSLYVRSGPGTSYSAIASLARGTVVSFSCYANGTAVTGPYGTETAWDRLDSGGYVSDAWIYTGSNSTVVPLCGPSVKCHAKSCVGQNPGTEGCTADAKIVRQNQVIWEPRGREAAVVWEYHSDACDAAWFKVRAIDPDDGDSANLSAWNPGGPSQHFTFSVGDYGKVSTTSSAMVDDENGVQACAGAHVYYLKAVTVNGQVKLVKTYFMWEFLGCR